MFCLFISCSSEIDGTVASIINTDGSVSNALNFLRSIQQSDGCISNFAVSSWAVMAIAAAGEDPHDWNGSSGQSIVDYLISNRNMLNLSKTLDVARFILSMTAADENPRNISGTDYAEIIKSHFVNGQLGTEAWLNDDFWGLLALMSAGEAANSTVIQETVEFVRTHQSNDGGWGWAVDGGSDVDDTAAAIMALVSAGEDNSTEIINNALQYLRNNQQPNGGFQSWGVTNSASDSWVIGAICSAGQNPAEWQVNGTTVIEHLSSLQNEDGSFNWSRNDPLWVDKAWYTSYAIVGLCFRQFPVNGLPVYIRIEGDQAIIWRRKVFVASSIIVDDQGQDHYFTEPTALGCLDKAAEVGSFNYKVEQVGWNLYLYSVAGEEETGTKKWMYRINYVKPELEADAFIWYATSPPQPPHKELLFYFGELTNSPLKITVDKTIVTSGDNITAFVTYFNDTEQLWHSLEGAIVHLLGGQYVTNATGHAIVTVLYDAPIWAEKEDFIRSDTVEITVNHAHEGDINGDGVVNILDAILLANAFGSKPGDPNWNPNADLNNDDIVNILDAIILANHFGETWE